MILKGKTKIEKLETVLTFLTPTAKKNALHNVKRRVFWVNQYPMEIPG